MAGRTSWRAMRAILDPSSSGSACGWRAARGLSRSQRCRQVGEKGEDEALRPFCSRKRATTRKTRKWAPMAKRRSHKTATCGMGRAHARNDAMRGKAQQSSKTREQIDAAYGPSTCRRQAATSAAPADAPCSVSEKYVGQCRRAKCSKQKNASISVGKNVNNNAATAQRFAPPVLARCASCLAKRSAFNNRANCAFRSSRPFRNTSSQRKVRAASLRIWSSAAQGPRRTRSRYVVESKRPKPKSSFHAIGRDAASVSPAMTRLLSVNMRVSLLSRSTSSNSTARGEGRRLVFFVFFVFFLAS
mmetsp:Transcript_2002/g.5934  ORF Transcript_2002/g.5934 Transcript_2002/m.5934 type:complete len:302 (-) Transcript_2002:185-1090(-)